MFVLTPFLGNETEDSWGISWRGGGERSGNTFERALTMHMTGRRLRISSVPGSHRFRELKKTNLEPDLLNLGSMIAVQDSLGPIC